MKMCIRFRDDLTGVRDELIPKLSLIRRSFPLWMKFQTKKECRREIKLGAISIIVLRIKIKKNIGGYEIQ